ncbi:MAG TPA: hypothetical protein VHN98_08205 [Acidimicrobiales bacterium]|nr:hypothetical protein [Acidimicrobiales bacterium]
MTTTSFLDRTFADVTAAADAAFRESFLAVAGPGYGPEVEVAWVAWRAALRVGATVRQAVTVATDAALDRNARRRRRRLPDSTVIAAVEVADTWARAGF